MISQIAPKHVRTRRLYEIHSRMVGDFGKEIEVRDGVKAGDRVILNPPVDLVEGSKVQARPENTSQK